MAILCWISCVHCCDMFRNSTGRIPALTKEVKNMSNQNRVLSRQRARELNPDEWEFVSGGFITLSICTAMPTPDGDHRPFEAGC